MAEPPLPLPLDIDQVKGFLDPAEGAALQWAAMEGSRLGGCLEIGAYCGKSAIYIGAALTGLGAVLFSVDHHRGSEENQPGWEYHDTDLWDDAAGAMDTLPHLRRNLRTAGLEKTVIPIVGRSADVAAYWGGRLGFLFIDGGHTLEAALADYRGWTPHLAPGGLLAIHDVFPDPADGGRPPYEIYQRALASDLFTEVESIKSLRVLRRL
jgi:predicted O-methyltransferase YrrM